MESSWGYTSMHPGQAPNDFVKHGVRDSHRYKLCYNNMQHSTNVVVQKRNPGIKMWERERLIQLSCKHCQYCFNSQVLWIFFEIF